LTSSIIFLVASFPIQKLLDQLIYTKAIRVKIIRWAYLYSGASNAIPFVISASAILRPHSKIHTTVQMENCPNQFLNSIN